MVVLSMLLQGYFISMQMCQQVTNIQTEVFSSRAQNRVHHCGLNTDAYHQTPT